MIAVQIMFEAYSGKTEENRMGKSPSFPELLLLSITKCQWHDVHGQGPGVGHPSNAGILHKWYVSIECELLNTDVALQYFTHQSRQPQSVLSTRRKSLTRLTRGILQGQDYQRLKNKKYGFSGTGDSLCPS